MSLGLQVPQAATVQLERSVYLVQRALLVLAQPELRVLPDSTERPVQQASLVFQVPLERLVYLVPLVQQAWLACPVPRVRLALTAQLEPQVPPE